MEGFTEVEDHGSENFNPKVIHLRPLCFCKSGMVK